LNRIGGKGSGRIQDTSNVNLVSPECPLSLGHHRARCVAVLDHWMKLVALILKTNLPTLPSLGRASADLFLSAFSTSSCTEHKRGHKALAIISSWAGEVSCACPGLELKLLIPYSLQRVKGAKKPCGAEPPEHFFSSDPPCAEVEPWRGGGKRPHITRTERIYSYLTAKLSVSQQVRGSGEYPGGG
jgi:hypothetical protein